jgi:predicted lactoylglutathione lyase
MRQIFVNLPVIEKDSIHAMLISDREVNDLVAKATAAGGKAIKEQDHGFMYYRSFEEPDGHIWELLHMRSEPQ